MDNQLTVTFPGGKRVDASYKGFHIPTDQPVYQGGEGSAPAPFDLFLVSVATCAGIYVLSFAQNRGIDMSDASLNMTLRQSQESEPSDVMRLEIRLPAGFPEKYRKAVIKAVNGCAVKAYFEHPPTFEVVLT